MLLVASRYRTGVSNTRPAELLDMARSHFEFYYEVFNVIFVACYTKNIPTSSSFLNMKIHR